MKFISTYIILIILLSLVVSCSNNQSNIDSINDEENIVEADEFINEASPEDEIGTDSVKLIFYDLTSPVELCSFLKTKGSSFDQGLVNPVENKSRYNVSLKHAVNMGVYGTDLIYCRSFNERQVAIDYLAAIKGLTQEIGIPEDQISKTIEKADKYMDNKDSIFNIVQKTYNKSDSYLNDNDRKSTAALIYFGAWTEALHLAINLYGKDEANKDEIALHIAEQKFSLNNLLTLLRNSYDNPDVYNYIIMIRRLKKVYDEIDIIAENYNTEIDTINKTISINRNKTKISEEQINDINNIIRRIRNDMIS